MSHKTIQKRGKKPQLLKKLKESFNQEIQFFPKKKQLQLPQPNKLLQPHQQRNKTQSRKLRIKRKLQLKKLSKKLMLELQGLQLSQKVVMVETRRQQRIIPSQELSHLLTFGAQMSNIPTNLPMETKMMTKNSKMKMIPMI